MTLEKKQAVAKGLRLLSAFVVSILDGCSEAAVCTHLYTVFTRGRLQSLNV